MAIGNNNATANSATQWVVEIYSFLAPDPENETPSTAGSVGVSVIGTSALAANSVMPDITSATIPDLKQNQGLKTVSLRRDKASVAGACHLSFVGPLPNGVIAGTWLVVSSLYRLDSASLKSQMIRFIGQIQEVDTSYIMQPSGLLSIQTNVTAREWSHALEMPINFSDYSVFSPDNIETGLPSQGEAVLEAAGITGEDVAKVMTASWNPFELAQVVLRLAGAMNSSQTSKSVVAGVPGEFSDVSLTMPSLPSQILTRLGLPDAEPERPFSTGFVTFLTGVQPKINNPPNWNGVWPGDSFENYRKSFLMPKDRPAALGIAVFAQPGIVAWDVISNHCEPAINEFFTDIFYQHATIDGVEQIVARPTIVVRDKPFLLSKMKTKLLGIDPTAKLDTWSIYDDLPRVSIPNSFILGLKVGHTSVNSPNYVQVNLHTDQSAADLDSAESLQLGRMRLVPQMRRFGGIRHGVETTFVSANSGKDESDFNFLEWFKTLKFLSVGWNSYDYRFGNGTIMLADGPFAISIGFNVQFEFGDFALVGHVDALDITHRVTESGLNETRMQAHLSRIVKLLPDGSLDFLDMDDFGRLDIANPNAKKETEQGIASTTESAQLPTLAQLGLPDIGGF